MGFEVSVSSITIFSISSNVVIFSSATKSLHSSLNLMKLPDNSSPCVSFLSKLTGRRRRNRSHLFRPDTRLSCTSVSGSQVNNSPTAQLGDPMEAQLVEGYNMTQFCDKIIDLFLNEKPKVKEWRKYLVLREEWTKYRESFYKRCQFQTDKEVDPTRKQKLVSLVSKVKKIDAEMDKHNDLLKEIQDSPTDVNAIVAKRRSDFTGEFFRYVALVSETFDSLEDRDGLSRLSARCLSGVSAYDKTLESVETLDAAQAKFDEILNSSSVDVACEKITSLAKAKELDSSLILLINSAWAAAKESNTITNEAKDIMYRLYKATKSSLRSIAPKEIKLLKYLLNITDPEERFSALATAFSPGDDHEVKDPKALYTTPKELQKWITIMLDAYHLNKEDTDIREAKQMSQPMVIQRLFILKETIEEEYLAKPPLGNQTEGDSNSDEL